MTALIRCPPAHAKALLTAREKGWVLGIVTNGAVGPQEAKIRRTGLADLVDGWVVSEAVAIDKPDPRIFRMAADRCGIRSAAATARRGPSATGWWATIRPRTSPGRRSRA
ncbi:HAD family hydrolase [Streptacidiphilus monticola]